MTVIHRRSAIIGSAIASALPVVGGTGATAAGTSIGQKWIDGWNSPNPEVLVSAFTPDGVYEDVTFGLKKKGSAELRELHKFFHDSVEGLYVKQIATHVSNGMALSSGCSVVRMSACSRLTSLSRCKA